MITIEERFANKLPEVTSLFIKLEFFDKKIFDFLVQLQESIYNKTNNEFEISINKLYFIVNYLTNSYDVKIKLLPDWFM